MYSDGIHPHENIYSIYILYTMYTSSRTRHCRTVVEGATRSNKLCDVNSFYSFVYICLFFPLSGVYYLFYLFILFVCEDDVVF